MLDSVQVVRKANRFNAHSDITALPAALSNKSKIHFVGMLRALTQLFPKNRSSAALS